jgi:KUP system potassium uptake protein
MNSNSPGELGGPTGPKAGRGALALTGLAALGIVFGDIGTSPLYTLKTAFDFLQGDATPERILGILSLLIWTLFIVTSVKYVMVAMSIDNDGEGGILALMSLLGVKQVRPAIIVAGLLGAALIYGDGAITPAISVLSALEGLNIAAPGLGPYVLPAAVVILAALFAVQPLGTARIGAAFGPIMAFWFVSIGTLGLWGIAQDPWVFGRSILITAFICLPTTGCAAFLSWAEFSSV